MCKINPIGVVVFGIIICTFIFMILPDKMDTTFYTKLNIVLLLLTAIVVLWYTIETHFLRVIGNKQIDLSVMPSIVVSKEEGKDSFCILNVGNGVAINIKFEDIIISSEFKIWLRLPNVLSLLPLESKVVRIESYSGGNITEYPFTANIDDQYANQQFEAIVTFEDIARQKYRQIFNIGKDGPYLGEISRVK